jgi:hypothetical protein
VFGRTIVVGLACANFKFERSFLRVVAVGAGHTGAFPCMSNFNAITHDSGEFL